MVPFERAFVTSYRLSIVTFPLSLCVSDILPLLCSSTPLFPTPPLVSPKFPHVSLGVGGWPLGYEEWRCLIDRAISFQDFQLMWSWSTNVTDKHRHRQTDRQTCNRIQYYTNSDWHRGQWWALFPSVAGVLPKCRRHVGNMGNIPATEGNKAHHWPMTLVTICFVIRLVEIKRAITRSICIFSHFICLFLHHHNNNKHRRLPWRCEAAQINRNRLESFIY